MNPKLNEREATIAVVDEIRSLQKLKRLPDAMIKLTTCEAHNSKGVLYYYLITFKLGLKSYRAHVSAENGKVTMMGGN